MAPWTGERPYGSSRSQERASRTEKATLTGTVYHASERNEAEHIAFLTDGVWSVENELKLPGD
jgi:hypothetical protein